MAVVVKCYHNNGSSIQVLSGEETEIGDSDSTEEELGDADNDEILGNGDSEGENYNDRLGEEMEVNENDVNDLDSELGS